METRLDYEKLLADYHRLPSEGQKELQEFAAFLVKKYHAASHDATSPDNQCTLGKREDKRPEAAAEPIFTE